MLFFFLNFHYLVSHDVNEQPAKNQHFLKTENMYSKSLKNLKNDILYENVIVILSPLYIVICEFVSSVSEFNSDCEYDNTQLILDCQ